MATDIITVFMILFSIHIGQVLGDIEFLTVGDGTQTGILTILGITGIRVITTIGAGQILIIVHLIILDILTDITTDLIITMIVTITMDVITEMEQILTEEEIA